MKGQQRFSSPEAVELQERADLPSPEDPIEQIRRVEAEITRQIAAAREAAERTLAQARRQAEQAIEDARQTGRLEGEALLRETLARAEKEARQIVLQARRRSDELKHKNQARKKTALDWAVRFTLGLTNDRFPEDER